MDQRRTTWKKFEWLTYLNHSVLAAIAALAMGLWTPGTASATAIFAVEPNNTGLTAQDVNFFSLDFVNNINNDANSNTSTTIPHVSITRDSAHQGTGYDFYRFHSNGGILILDIDSTPGGGAFTDNDTVIGLWNAAGNFLKISDDGEFLDTGSNPNDIPCGPTCNSFMQETVGAGDYIVAVCRATCDGFTNGFGINGPAISDSGFYTLHISTPHDLVATPEPSAMLLIGSGLVVGLGVLSRRRKTTKTVG